MCVRVGVYKYIRHMCICMCVSQVAGSSSRDTNHECSHSSSSDRDNGSDASASNLGPGYFKLALGPDTLPVAARLSGETHCLAELH